MGIEPRALIQRQLLELDLPLVRPPGSRAAPVFNGESVRFGEGASRHGITPAAVAKLVLSTLADRELKTKRPAFVVLIPWGRLADPGGHVLGETVFPVTDAEIIRYQLVMIRRGQARFLGACEDGMFFEADEDDLLPWTGPGPARRAA